MDPQNREVGRKLGIATALMFTLPLGAYFLTRYWLLSASSSSSSSSPFQQQQQQWFSADEWAAAAAILVTNCIVGGYCYVAYQEDRSNDDENDNANDAKHPRSGMYKERTD